MNGTFGTNVKVLINNLRGRGRYHQLWPRSEKTVNYDVTSKMTFNYLPHLWLQFANGSNLRSMFMNALD